MPRKLCSFYWMFDLRRFSFAGLPLELAQWRPSVSKKLCTLNKSSTTIWKFMFSYLIRSSTTLRGTSRAQHAGAADMWWLNLAAQPSWIMWWRWQAHLHSRMSRIFFFQRDLNTFTQSAMMQRDTMPNRRYRPLEDFRAADNDKQRFFLIRSKGVSITRELENQIKRNPRLSGLWRLSGRSIKIFADGVQKPRWGDNKWYSR